MRDLGQQDKKTENDSFVQEDGFTRRLFVFLCLAGGLYLWAIEMSYSPMNALVIPVIGFIISFIIWPSLKKAWNGFKRYQK